MKKRLLLIILLSALLCACARGDTPAETGTPAFSLEILSTGKSDCTILRMDGCTVLIDTADADDFDTIADRLRAMGVSDIDYLILSHYDKDHVGSAADILRAFTVGEVISTAYPEDNSETLALQKAASETHVPLTMLTQVRTITTENGSITMDPPRHDFGDDNDNSLIAAVTYRGESFLFLGDARKARLEEYYPNAPERTMLVKLPHHGEGTKVLYSLLRTRTPRWAAVTLDRGERIDDKLLDVLGESAVTLCSTSNGNVCVTYDNGEFTIIQ